MLCSFTAVYTPGFLKDPRFQEISSHPYSATNLFPCCRNDERHIISTLTELSSPCQAQFDEPVPLSPAAGGTGMGATARRGGVTTAAGVGAGAAGAATATA